MMGLSKSEIETPALLLDLDLLESNIEIMSTYFAGKKAKLRPHFKTYKSPMIAHKQVAAGAKGITCSKTSEAEVLAQAGIKDILIANQIVDPGKLLRLAGLSKNGARITVAVDSPENVKSLSDAAAVLGTTLYALVEVQVGMDRCGVYSQEDVLRLARQIASSPGLEFEGLQAYEGHLCHIPERGKRSAGVKSMVDKITAIKDYLSANGLPLRQVSGGGTGTYDITGDNSPWTEIQAGSYIFMDSDYDNLQLPFKNSLTVMATVIHKRPGIAITDAGIKACTNDGGPVRVRGYPHLSVNLHEEHGIIRDDRDELRFLEKIEYVPSHCCTTVNLYDDYHGIRADKFEVVIPISGRGKSQ